MKVIVYLLAALLFPIVVPVNAENRMGQIEFFGYKGFDPGVIRPALPVQEGTPLPTALKEQVNGAVTAAIGREPTDVHVTCCDERGDNLLFIGLPGASSKTLPYSAAPQGPARFPAALLSLYERLDRAIETAVRKGGQAAEEDDSQGYALIKEPGARALQLRVRDWAIRQESTLLQVLATSYDARHRRIAADALGYVNSSRRQIVGLVRAARDPDDEVRNNATRALGVLLEAKPTLARHVPPGIFIDMLSSGIWSDRNKSVFVLSKLTANRNAALLAALRASALDALIEMASWRRAGHAGLARVLLGRMAGIPEDKLNALAWNGPVSTILEAVANK